MLDSNSFHEEKNESIREAKMIKSIESDDVQLQGKSYF